MVKVFCVIVGEARSAFFVRVDEAKLAHDYSVDDLKNAIKIKLNDLDHVDADWLQLYLAKKDGTWLTGADAAAVTLDETNNAPVMLDERGHQQGFELMNSLLYLKNTLYFGVNFQPGEEKIHVLVLVPEHEATAATVSWAPVSDLDEVGRSKRKRGAGRFFEQVSALARIGQQLNRGTDLAVGNLLKLSGIILTTNMTKGVYIRQEYWDISNIIQDKLSAYECLRRVLVVGSSGIGKSVFGVFLLLLFLTERKDTAYRPLGDSHIYYFSWNNTYGYDVSTERLADKEYLGLFDGNEANGALLAHVFRCAFVLASPRSNNYNEFVKEYCFTLYMNPWTKTECEKL